MSVTGGRRAVLVRALVGLDPFAVLLGRRALPTIASTG
jgi:hypothetical protein